MPHTWTYTWLRLVDSSNPFSLFVLCSFNALLCMVLQLFQKALWKGWNENGIVNLSMCACVWLNPTCYMGLFETASSHLDKTHETALELVNWHTKKCIHFQYGCSRIYKNKSNKSKWAKRLNAYIKMIWAVTLETNCLLSVEKGIEFRKILFFDLVFIVFQSKVHIRLPNKSIVSMGDQLIPACNELTEFKGFPKVTKWHQLGQC